MFTIKEIKKALKTKGYTDYEINHTINLIKEISKGTLDYSKIDNIEFDGIDHSDAPDYCDAYIVSANYDGVPMTEEQIEELNEDSEFVYESLMNYLH
jgi:hypothetical protein